MERTAGNRVRIRSMRGAKAVDPGAPGFQQASPKLREVIKWNSADL